MRLKTIRVSDRELALIKRARDLLQERAGEALENAGLPVETEISLGAVIGLGSKILLSITEGEG
jgi:hypothetical protein